MFTSGSALLRVVSVRSGGMVGGGGMSGDMGGGMTGVGWIDSAIDWILALPPWMSATLITAIVLLAAALCGWIIAKIYLSIRFPNPEKPQYLSPIQKVVVLVIGVVIVTMLMNSLLDTGESDMMVNGEGMEDPYGDMGDMGDPEGNMNPGDFDESGEGEESGKALPEGEAGNDTSADMGDSIQVNPGGNIQVNPGTAGGGAAVAVAEPRVG